MVITKKPEWIRVKGVDESVLNEMKALLDRYHLHTVCESAVCPNMGSCFKAGTATFMILGNICTRNCAFCGVDTGKPLDPDPEEPENVARASRDLNLKHVVVTSVTRDDLPDGGAGQFAKTIAAINRILPEATTDVLIPDLKASIENLKIVIDARPDILAHNLETVPRLYLTMRQGASYENSLQVLANSKKAQSAKSARNPASCWAWARSAMRLLGVMRDLRSVDCDFLTLGQYLRPAAENLEVTEFITPEAFEEYRVLGYEMGFRYVASSPFVRSSFHAEEALKAIGHGHAPAN